MASASSSTYNLSKYKCPLCEDFYVKPKLLPCAHYVCRDCLCRSGTAKCPICVSQIFDCLDQKDIENVVDKLSTDFSFESIVHSARYLNEQQCDNCPGGNAAVSVCYDCDTKLCAACKKAHAAVKFLRHHKVERLSRTTPEEHARRRPLFCKVHQDAICEKYCSVHIVSVCFKCAFEVHNSCKKVHNLDEKIKQVETALAKLEEDLSLAEENLNSAIQQSVEDIKQAEKARQKSLEDIDVQLDSVKKEVETCRDKLKSQANAAFSGYKTVKERRKMTLSERYSILKSNLGIIQRARENIPREQPDDALRMFQEQIRGLNLTTNVGDVDDEEMPTERVRIDSEQVHSIVRSIQGITSIGRLPRPQTSDAFTQTDRVERRPSSTQTPFLVKASIGSLERFCFQVVCTRLNPDDSCADSSSEDSTQKQEEKIDAETPASDMPFEQQLSEETEVKSFYQAASRQNDSPRQRLSPQNTMSGDFSTTNPNPPRDELRSGEVSRTDSDVPHTRPACGVPYTRPACDVPYTRPDSDVPYTRPASDVPHARPVSGIPCAKEAGDIPYARPAGVAPDESLIGPGARRLLPARYSSKPCSFSGKKGSGVVLSNYGHTANFHGKAGGGGLVLAADPMEKLRLYRVILEKVPGGNCTMTVGAIFTDKLRTLNIPASARFWASAVAFSPTQSESRLVKALGSLKKKDSVGVLLDSSECLHVFVNGQDVGCAPVQGRLHQPCFAFFELAFYNGCTQISTCPVELYIEGK